MLGAFLLSGFLSDGLLRWRLSDGSLLVGSKLHSLRFGNSLFPCNVSITIIYRLVCTSTVKSFMLTHLLCRSIAMRPTAMLWNVLTAERFLINAGKEFVIGRSITCLLKINEVYIKRRHCFIEYENDQFIIYGNSSCVGTFLNGNELLPGKNNSFVLKSRDLISFGRIKKNDYVFKFYLLKTNPRMYKDCNALEIPSKLVGSQRLKLMKEIKNSIFEFRKVLGTIIKLKKTYLIDVDVHKKLNKQEPFKEFNDKIFELLAIYFRCSICNDVVIKAITTKCRHNFCKHCIEKWLRVKNNCPLCRSPNIRTKRNCSIDMFLKKVYKLISGPRKMQRRTRLIKIENNETVNKMACMCSRRASSEILYSPPIDVDEPITLSD